MAAAAAAKSLQSCPTLCNPRDSSPPGSRVPGILQARTLEWVAISSSNAWKWKVKAKSLSRVWLLATPWTAAYQAPPPMGLSRQEYWSGVPLLRWQYSPNRSIDNAYWNPTCLFFLRFCLFAFILFLALKSLYCCVWAFSSHSKWELLSSLGCLGFSLGWFLFVVEH